jgi:hypothetical protein
MMVSLSLGWKRIVFTTAASIAYSSAGWIADTDNMVYNAWNHIAVTRSAGIIRIFCNGKKFTEVNDESDFQGGDMAIGFRKYSTYVDTEYLWNNTDELHIVKGAALWTADFTPPGAPYTL